VKRLEERFRWIAEELLVPTIHGCRHAELNHSSYKKPDDFLQWMMDLADNDFNKDPVNLAHGLTTFMALAVVHTSTMLVTHAMYDLVMHPEYLEPLREEILDTLKNGWINASPSEFAAQRSLDSFLHESQRLYPTSEGKFLSATTTTIYQPLHYHQRAKM
jgi:cytochrome P450